MKAWFAHILFHSRMQPQRPAIVLMDRAITYGMLAEGIESCARQLVELDLGGAAPVAVAVKNPLRQMVLNLALMRMGVASLTLEDISGAPSDMKFAVMLCDANIAPPAGVAHRFVAVPDSWFDAGGSRGTALPSGFVASDQICRYSLTSGSTGEPKLFSDTIASFGTRVFNNIFGGIDASRNGVLCMLGLSTTFGFANACATLAAGRTLYLTDSSGQAMAMIELFSIDFLLASTEQVLALAGTARRTGALVHSLRTIVMGGNVPTRTLLEAAMTYLCKDILCQYGATEIGPIARTRGRAVLAAPGLVGFVIPGVEVGIFDAAGKTRAEGQVGSIKVRHAQDAGPPGVSPGSNWIALGDFGWFAPDGRLYVTGRTNEAIADTRISPALEAEHLLRMEYECDDAAALMHAAGAAETKPLVKIGVVNNRDATAGRLAASLMARGIDVNVELYDLKFIPRGAGGKVNRVQLKSALATAKQIVSKPQQ
jgi:acyl-coenzyme A synthetase/AMP-(fatty) acid ligase